MFKKLTIISLILLLNLASMVCTTEPQLRKVIYIGYTLEKPFWSELGKKIKSYAKINGIDIIDLTPPFLPFDKEQTQLMDYALKEKVSALILGLGSPINHTKLNAILDKFKTANIPVILIDTNFPHPAVTAFITSDNLFGARLAGNYIVEKMKKQKNPRALILGGEKMHPNSQLRIQGVAEAFEKEKINYRVTYADWANEKAYNLSKQFLTKDTEFTAVFSCWDPGIIISEAYWRTMNSKQKIIFIGFDGLPQTIELIRLGRIDATIAQNSEKMA
ncbi:MAG: sugar ABC transporter substrate-binding protein, partial [Candidatus Riflemargulisbacteria bacterium]